MSLGIQRIDDPRLENEWLRDALWFSKNRYYGFADDFSKARIEEAKRFCERLELSAMVLGAGNIFGVTAISDFLDLAESAGWKLHEDLSRVQSR